MRLHTTRIGSQRQVDSLSSLAYLASAIVRACRCLPLRDLLQGLSPISACLRIKQIETYASLPSVTQYLAYLFNPNIPHSLLSDFASLPPTFQQLFSFLRRLFDNEPMWQTHFLSPCVAVALGQMPLQMLTFLDQFEELGRVHARMGQESIRLSA